MKGLKGIIISGPGPTKEDFLKGNYLDSKTKELVIGTVNIGYTGDFGLEETVAKSSELLEKEEVTKEKKILERFFNTLGSNTEMAAYGEEKVKKALDLGAVDTLILSETFDDDKAEKLITKAEESGSTWHIVSNDTREGEQLVGLGKIGAVLRYKLS